jgi:ribosomal protein S18 acetylase RimI-like enzyme
MGLTRRAFAGAGDLALVAELVGVAPVASRHLVDLPWRLAAPAGETGRDVMLWFDEAGQIVGFAAWQVWWAALDFFARPGPRRAEVEETIFAWAPARFRELDAERGRPLPYWAEAREDDAGRLALLARHGYTLDDDYAYVLLERPLDGPVPPPALPDGFGIRPLAGEREVAAYAALHRRAFDSGSMTPEWRARTLRMPQYRRDLDLVAVAPDGRLAGFCVGWLAPDGGVGQIEPLGVDPDYRGLGLSRALLLAFFARLRAADATRAWVETESTRAAALAAYEAVGFRQTHRSVRKGQWFTGGKDCL